MRIHFKIIAVTISLVVGGQFSGCNMSSPASQSSYFPLDADSVSIMRSASGGSLLLTVTGMTHSGSRAFYRVEQRYRFRSGNEAVETREYFVSDSGSVLRRYIGPDSVLASRVRAPEGKSIPRDGVSMWYDLRAKPGQTWIAYSNTELPFVNSPMLHHAVSEYRLTLESCTDTVALEGRLITECMRFRIENLNTSGGPYLDWLARGLGLVRRKWVYSADSSAYLFSERISGLGSKE